MSWSFDDDSQPSGNSTCSEFSTCSGCIDYFDPDGVGCLWCNVPKDASSLPSAGGLCLPRLRAQDSCEIGELQATCQEGAGWYVLVLTLSALLCCCCFLTMARKFAAMWHERWWLASGGELSTPLLDEDGEEQQHEVIFRSSLADAAGTSSWRCPVCAFDNRPRCKHCDLCGMSSEFAEVYWKDRDASKRRGDGARSKKRTEASVEEGKATAGGEAKPQTPPADDATNATADSGEAGENRSGGGGRGGGSGGAGRRGGRGQTAGGTRGSTEDPDGNTRLKRGGTEGTGWGESGGGAGAAGDVEEEPEATPLLSGGDGDGSGSIGGGGGSGDEASPSAEIDGDMGGDEEEGEGNGRGAGRRVGASLGGETPEGGKPRRAPFRMRRLGNLTERQKRARRRRIWQRVIGPDGSQRWLQSVENPAASLAAASAAAAAAAAPAASGYQPPSLSPALSPSSAATAATAAAAASSEGGARRGRGGVPAVAAAAAANAAAVLLYWTSRPRRAAASTSSSSGAAGGGDSASEPLLSEAQQQQYEASTSIGGGGTVSGGARGGDAGDSLLSAVERGEGAESRRSSFASSSPPSLKRGREGSGGSDDWFRVSPSGSGAGGAGGAGAQERGGGGGGGGGDSGRNGGSGRREKGKVSPAVKTTTAVAMEAATLTRCDSFGDEVMASKCPGYYVTFLEGGGLALDEAHDGEPVVQPHPLPPSATRRGPLAGEGTATITLPPPPPPSADDRSSSGGGGAGRGRGGGGVSGGGGGGISIGSHGFGLGTGPSARPGVAGGGGVYGEGTARRREARREEAASEEWISSTRKEVVKLCDVASRPFWQKHSWFLDQLKLLQVPHGAGMEAMRIEVNRKNLLEDSYAQVSAMNVGELRRWLRVQFVGEPGVDAGGLEREWFMLVCSALFDPSTGLFTPQPGNGAFAINPSSGVANEMHLEYFRFTGRVLGKLLMEHSVVPYHLSLPILKHLLGLPVAFSDLEFADPELHRNLQWLSTNPGAESLGLDFTVTMESFGVKEIVELVPAGKDIAVTDDNKEHYLQLRLRHRVLDGTHGQLWHLMRGLYDVIPSHLISVFDYQELELLLCGIPEIDVSEWKRCSRYLGDYRRAGENHMVIKWFWEVVEAFSEEEKARFLQFCTGSSRLPAHGFKALQSNDGSFRAFSLQSITKRDSAFPRAHTCFNKLDLPTYESKKELEECLGLCICFELTGFTID